MYQENPRADGEGGCPFPGVGRHARSMWYVIHAFIMRFDDGYLHMQAISLVKMESQGYLSVLLAALVLASPH